MRYPAIGGTRFRLYPSYAEGFAEPEVVELSLPAGTVRAGPSDHSMCVVNPVQKDAPYDPPHYVPPYRGPVYAPALPGPDGHFDHIPVETEQFLAAHLYGTVRWTLDIWEHYLRRRGRLVGRRCPSAVGAHPDRALAECAVRTWLPGDGPQAEPDGSAAAILPQLRCHGARNRAFDSVLPGRRPRDRPDQRAVSRISRIVRRSGGTDRRAAFRTRSRPGCWSRPVAIFTC